MPHALFTLYLHLLGRPSLGTIALAIVRLAHALCAGAHSAELPRAAQVLRSSAVHFAGVCPGVTVDDLAAAMPPDTSTLPMVPPGLGVTWLTFLLELAESAPERIQVSTPKARWEALLASAVAFGQAQEALEDELGRHPTDRAPPPAMASGEVPRG